ncbi:hypothetical protein D0862_12652 [Hortaea werneckii]|uniref:L-tryptophan decarboxylase PsiD-like domain-containing protein n=1 Tax=Hortaea werneckii TaxID=91943 RepID=A0A3M7EVQ6_HORWE|nr:hypothetical protein D0862_12652 [Hortaea werneckii]
MAPPFHRQTGCLQASEIGSRTLGDWLPSNKTAIQHWVNTKASEAKRCHNGTLEPVIQDFKQAIESDPVLSRYADQMFVEVPNKYKAPYNETPVGNPELRNFSDFLILLDHIIHEGPGWFDKRSPPTANDLIGFPITAALDWPLGTIAGHEFFLSPVVSHHIGRVLDFWALYLGTPPSASVLAGWLSPEGKDQIAAAGNLGGKTNYTFEQLFCCPNTSAPYLGYKTWDQYFVREFNPGIRPIAAPDNQTFDPEYHVDPTLIIDNACESAPLQQPYSLTNMLNFHPLANTFVGGTVYQAYLSTLSYHRWHAPVSGRIVHIENVPGTYYSGNLFTGLAETSYTGQAPDDSAPNYSQPYISAVATRGIVYIQARNPAIGLMAIVFVGMGEVSSCEFTVDVGQEVNKGDQLGMFHFGGSTHVMVFQPGVELDFVKPIPHGDVASGSFLSETNFAVRSALAVVRT